MRASLGETCSRLWRDHHGLTAGQELRRLAKNLDNFVGKGYVLPITRVERDRVGTGLEHGGQPVELINVLGCKERQLHDLTSSFHARGASGPVGIKNFRMTFLNVRRAECPRRYFKWDLVLILAIQCASRLAGVAVTVPGSVVRPGPPIGHLDGAEREFHPVLAQGSVDRSAQLQRVTHAWVMTLDGTAAYDEREDLPLVVQRAVEAARFQGFTNSCLPSHGRLLRLLAGGVGEGVIGETGTGCGVGLAWLASGARRCSPGEHRA